MISGHGQRGFHGSDTSGSAGIGVRICVLPEDVRKEISFLG
jgi:hypothetical protein